MGETLAAVLVVHQRLSWTIGRLSISVHTAILGLMKGSIVVVQCNRSVMMWIARDMSGSGLYTLWVDQRPEINKDGYYKVNEALMGTLLMTIHPSKFPWPSIKLVRGECVEFNLNKASASQTTLQNTGESNVAVE